jgi:hypothetical protein
MIISPRLSIRFNIMLLKISSMFRRRPSRAGIRRRCGRLCGSAFRSGIWCWMLSSGRVRSCRSTSRVLISRSSIYGVVSSERLSVAPVSSCRFTGSLTSSVKIQSSLTLLASWPKSLSTASNTYR